MPVGPAAAVLALSVALAPGGPARSPAPPRGDAAERTRVIVRLAPSSVPGPAASARGPGTRGVVAALRARTAANARALGPLLARWSGAGGVAGVRWLPIVNGFSVEATPEGAAALARLPMVVAVTPDAIDVVPLAAPAEPNVAAVQAPVLWSFGAVGEGATVAVLDTGLDAAHPDLAGRLRGWFDPYGVHATPFDPSGHGTWVAGVVAGGGEGGTAVGVAPGASLLVAKVFPDSGPASASAIHAAFEWVLDPDGDPATDDAPRVVNASWGLGSPGCNPEFREDVQALRAAGLLPVFAAGNQGPAASTGVSPANYPEALSVGAAGLDGTPWDGSARGPSACGGGPFPTLAAPGVDIRTTDLMGGYFTTSGTSLAAPHVAGVAALLAGGYPGVSGDVLQEALVGGARDLGPEGPDGATGYGLVDAGAAWELMRIWAEEHPHVNVPPVAVEDRVDFPPGRRLEVEVTSNDLDPDGRVIAVAIVSPPACGRVAVLGSRVLYAPRRGTHGEDRFTYRVMDDAGAWSAPAAVIVRVP